jgi:hypothetical protein
MCLGSKIWNGWRHVNIKGCDTMGIAIISITKECLPIIFRMLANWCANGIPIRIEKKLVDNYTKIFSQNGWYIDPRYWTYTDPLRFCWYASVEASQCVPESTEIMFNK